MNGDPLSDILTLVKAQSVISGGFYAGGSWAIHFPAPREVKLYAIVRGSCWLAREGWQEARLLEAGDCILLTDRRPLILASDPAAEPMSYLAAFANTRNGFATLGNGEEFLLLGGHVSLDPVRGFLLLDALPPLIHVRSTSAEAVAIQQLLAQLAGEVPGSRAGTGLAVTMLTQLIFLQVLRAHLADMDGTSIGWLRALGDESLAPALRLMHNEPSRNWQLNELARAVGMSRTTFALRFKTVVGVAPLTYLLHWRMRLAERALREQGTPVSTLALSLGYTSESAFSNAFKRVTGVAPKRYQMTGSGANLT